MRGAGCGGFGKPTQSLPGDPGPRVLHPADFSRGSSPHNPGGLFCSLCIPGLRGLLVKCAPDTSPHEDQAASLERREGGRAPGGCPRRLWRCPGQSQSTLGTWDLGSFLRFLIRGVGDVAFPCLRGAMRFTRGENEASAGGCCFSIKIGAGGTCREPGQRCSHRDGLCSQPGRVRQPLRASLKSPRTGEVQAPWDLTEEARFSPGAAERAAGEGTPSQPRPHHEGCSRSRKQRRLCAGRPLPSLGRWLWSCGCGGRSWGLPSDLLGERGPPLESSGKANLRDGPWVSGELWASWVGWLPV